jgi:hypothetical protein
MKSLISATLSPEAADVWQSWPKGQRSRMLSILIAESATLLEEKQALSRRVGHLLGILASYRANLQRIGARDPPYDRLNKTIIEGMILDINEITWGTVHHDPSLEPPID